MKKNILISYPTSKRNISERASLKTDEIIATSKKFGREYFDGSREYGYGGYRYDGRWIPVAKDIVKEYGLKAGSRVLDIGCAKGFLVKDLISVCPGLEVFGIDISSYALLNAEKEVIGRLHLGDARSLPFPNASFDLALSINTIHNLDKKGCIGALNEMARVAPNAGYVQVDAYRSKEEREMFLNWVLTAETHGTPEFWEEIISASNYKGNYYWTIL
jgi:SAM-dependent methyltransferase